MSTAPAPPDHLRSLDALRGVAITFVLLHHFAIFTPVEGLAGRLYISFAEFLAHGVDLFFALSGFLLVNSLPKDGASLTWLKGFWRRRIAKIVPLYLALILSVHLFIPGLLTMLGMESRASVLLGRAGDWPWHALFGSNWLFFREGVFNHPLLNVAWSLGVEVQFYVLLCVAFFTGLARSVRFWLAMALLAAAARLLALEWEWNWVRLITFTPGRLDAFALGALVALRPNWFGRGLRCLGLAVLAAPLVVTWSRHKEWVNLAGYTWVALASAAAIASCVGGEKSGGIGRASATAVSFFAFLGRISYAIYLTHVPVRIGVRHLCFAGDQVLDSPAAWGVHLLYVAVCGTVSILLGWAVWRWGERPAQSLILGRFRAKSGHLRTASA